MAEANGLTAMLSAFTPGGALLFGLCVGSLIFLISRLGLGSNLLTGREVQSLHIELGTVIEAEQDGQDDTVMADDLPREVHAQRQGAQLRWWRTDEVVIDESMGIN